ncbi:hypothetical protein PAMC26577_37070 [Caballeronia sordidicola]|uniref:Uncharacterized protein n=1 Tax=Caballeronia sordidicola TaxID=196367 RepID=A0A2C9XWX3_CABSO|nr:hypothetical protein PAMC26577_37070 [Caballeronia sordidicola]
MPLRHAGIQREIELAPAARTSPLAQQRAEFSNRFGRGLHSILIQCGFGRSGYAQLQSSRAYPAPTVMQGPTPEP